MCVVNRQYSSSSQQNLITYHPNGMLDRDQRTIKIIPLNNNNNNNNINNNSNSNRNDNRLLSMSAVIDQIDNKSIILNSYKNSNYSNNNNNKCKNNNCKYQMDNVNSIKKSVLSSSSSLLSSSLSSSTSSSILSNNCNCTENDLLNTDYNNHKKDLEKHMKFPIYKKTKLNSLLICICFWLLILHKTRAFPLKMAEENNHHHEGSLKCSDVRNAIEKILQQSNVSYEVNYNQLENYTQAVFNENHKNHHNMWRRKHFEWLFPNGEPLKLEDYDRLEEYDDEATQHLRLPGAPSREELTSELTNLYQRLKILAMAFENIRNDQENHMYEIMDNKHPNHHVHIMEYFKQQNNYVQALLRETKDGMRQLGINEPDVMNQIPEYNGVRELRDWIVTREHLKLLNYVLKAYKILTQRCT